MFLLILVYFYCFSCAGKPAEAKDTSATEGSFAVSCVCLRHFCCFFLKSTFFHFYLKCFGHNELISFLNLGYFLLFLQQISWLSQHESVPLNHSGTSLAGGWLEFVGQQPRCKSISKHANIRHRSICPVCKVPTLTARRLKTAEIYTESVQLTCKGEKSCFNSI